ncbi:hypothetical protein K438DRAFT_80257 [Mycena galopus ATCC 62051]|nr:hypothetical protein K438DRAFT_80257 [Mycena galopus ATCC 62051]
MESSFSEMLGTNVVPSDAECQRIRELLAGPQKEAAEITCEIERLQAMINELTKRRDFLNEFIDPHLALISSVRRLPRDVLAEIFAATLPADRNAIMSRREAPLLLCNVSRTWRAVALSTPRLWASLHIIAPTTDSMLTRINEAILIWLSRSGVLPLSIALVHPWGDADLDSSMLLDTLVRYSSRWGRVRFKHMPISSIESLAVLSPADVPVLKTCIIEPATGPSDAYSSHSLAFLGTTSLRSFTTNIEGISTFPLPWNRLRHLSLRSGRDALSVISLAKGLEFLGRCPNLETCILGLGRASVPGVEVPPVLQRLEHLRQISVADYTTGMTLNSTTPTTSFFENLDLPSLQTIEYTAISIQDFPFTPLLTPGNLLQSLCFQVIQMPSESVTKVLRLVPALRELAISYDDSLGDEFWTALTPTSQNTHVLCPELRIVNFTQFETTSDKQLLDFITARTSSHFADIHDIALLTKVYVQFDRPMRVDIIPTLRQAIPNGLDFDYRVRYKPLPGAWRENETYTEGERLSERWDPFSYVDASSSYSTGGPDPRFMGSVITTLAS